MAKKYYAVHQGKTPGVYSTWDECKKQVDGYSGAKYKSFKTKEEAENFAKFGKTSEVVKPKRKTSSVSVKAKAKKELRGKEAAIRQDECEIFAYIDGSFEKRLNRVGYGGIIIHDGKEIPFSKGTEDEEFTAYWNISGELLAAVEVMKYALKHGVKSCALYYDCQGIEMWGTGKWKTNNKLTRSYANFAKKVQEEVKIEFHKVAAHTGVKYNEMADRLAKNGLIVRK